MFLRIPIYKYYICSFLFAVPNIIYIYTYMFKKKWYVLVRSCCIAITLKSNSVTTIIGIYIYSSVIVLQYIKV